jgi:hypothetical protein
MLAAFDPRASTVAETTGSTQGDVLPHGVDDQGSVMMCLADSDLLSGQKPQRGYN